MAIIAIKSKLLVTRYKLKRVPHFSQRLPSTESFSTTLIDTVKRGRTVMRDRLQYTLPKVMCEIYWRLIDFLLLLCVNDIHSFPLFFV